MAELKTKPHDGDVLAFLHSIEDEKKRQDSFVILEMMTEITGQPPQMWGDSLVGFGHYHYKYASGREGDWFLTGFAPRKQNLTLYIMTGFADYAALLAPLGKYKIGKGCLYIKKIEDVNRDALRELIRHSVTQLSNS